MNLQENMSVKVVWLNYTENQFNIKYSNNTDNSEKYSGCQILIFSPKILFSMQMQADELTHSRKTWEV